MPFTLKLQDKAGSDLLDVSSYLQLGESGGMDPSPTFEEPSFLDAPLAEGQPLITVNERNREMVFPIWMTAATKDTFHALVTTLGKAAAKTKRVYVKDDGATNETYFDVTWARFEPSYKYLHARKKYLAGTLRIYSAPPFGHTGSARALSTGIGSAVVGAAVAYATIPAGSVAGDVAALIQAKIITGASGNQEAPRADGRVVGWAALPTGYVSFIPAASLYGLNSQASLIGRSGFPGSQAVGPRTSQATIPMLARFALSASPYAGDNRVFAYVRPGRPMPLAVSCTDENGAPIGPTALSRGVHGVHLVDLGVARVPTAAATVPFTLQWSLPPIGQDDSAMNLYTTNDRISGYLGGLLVFPEDKLRVHVDPIQPVGGRWFIGTAVASTVAHAVPDDFGNSYSVYTGGTMVLSPTLGLRHSGNGSSPFSLKMALPEAYENIRHRVMMNGPSIPAGGQYAFIVGGKGDFNYEPFIGAKFTPTGPSGPQLWLLHCQDGFVGFGANTSRATLALEPGAWTESATHGYIIDVVKQGDTAYANIRQFNKDNIQFFNAAGGSVIADTVASIGFVDGGLRGWRGQHVKVYSDGPGNGNVFGHFVDVLSQRPIPSDAYIFDGGAENDMSYRQSGNTGSPPLLMEPYLRGGPQQVDPDTARIVAFAAGLDAVRATNPLTVEVRVRERFRFMR